MKKPLEQEEIDTLLKSKSVSSRTQAMRHYEHFGTPEDISFIIQIASTDKSVAVRSSGADAISDILSRYRVSPYKESITEDERHVLLGQFRRIKVQQTPSVNLAYAALGTSRALSILLSGFVDPRVEMQNCAAAGLRCFCLSQDVLTNDNVEERLVKLLRGGTLDVPGIAHIVRLCAEAGYQKVVPVLDDLPDLGNLGEIVEATRIQMRQSLGRPLGLWCSNGLDALEFNPHVEREERFLLVLEDSVLCSEKGMWNENPKMLDGPSRRLYFRPIGSADSVQAVQTEEATWTSAQSADVQILLQQETQLDQPSSPHLLKLGLWLEGKLKDNQKNARSLAIIYMRAGAWDLCAQYLEKGMTYKKVSNDLWYVEAKRYLALGKKKRALDSLEKCLLACNTDRSILVRQCQELKAHIELG